MTQIKIGKFRILFHRLQFQVVRNTIKSTSEILGFYMKDQLNKFIRLVKMLGASEQRSVEEGGMQIGSNEENCF